MTTFGALAALLAVAGLYARVAHAAQRRTTEFVVRLALGASRADVLALVLRRGLRAALLGVAAGLAAASATGRLLAGLLCQVAPHDPATLGAGCGIVVVAAAAASALPAWRASRVDPLAALRSE
jgi:putative ABC transport system permease protein